MGKVERFEDLNCWKEARELVKEVYIICEKGKLSRDFDTKSQIKRAALSIMNNIAEGFGKQSYSKAELKRFIQMSIGSANEMRVWVRYCLDLGYIETKVWQMWRDEYDEISKMLQGLHSSIKIAKVTNY